MKRLFTKWLGGEVSMSATGVLEWLNEVMQFTSQEDLSVLGAQLAIEVKTPSENDNYQKLECELSFSSTPHMDISFLTAGSSAWWNTAPPGIDADHDNVVVMFPEGYGLTMKEGETVFLNAQTIAVPSAGTSTWIISAHLYYVKGKATSK